MSEKKRKKELPKLGLHISIEHFPSKEVPKDMNFERFEENHKEYIDQDGHIIRLNMNIYESDNLIDLSIRRGISSDKTIEILEKIAVLISNHREILNARQGFEFYCVDGVLKKDPLAIEYDDYGEPFLEDII